MFKYIEINHIMYHYLDMFSIIINTFINTDYSITDIIYCMGSK